MYNRKRDRTSVILNAAQLSGLTQVELAYQVLKGVLCTGEPNAQCNWDNISSI